jgi:predicted alpha/beta-fold hydrolase
MWAKFFRRRVALTTRDERLETDDGDFLDLVHFDATPDAPRILLLHGLEGTRRSHYVAGVFEQARARGWNATLLIFRGCGPELNRAKRFYHSGETSDLGRVVRRLTAAAPRRPLMLAGVSLGGNVVLKWLGENGDRLPPEIVAAAAVSVPFDLERGSRFLQRGFSKVYDRHFLRTLKTKARLKLQQHAGAYDPDALECARTIYDFDDVVTAPLHGFLDARDYYRRSSSMHFLSSIAVPTLLLSAVDDPFLPPVVLDEVRDIARHNDNIEAEFVPHGGHVGFVAGTLPWKPRYYAEERLGVFFESHLRQWHV